MKNFLNKHKQKILLAALAAILMAIVGGATYAYWTYAGRARNVITTGKIDISIVEKQLSSNGYIPYPDEPISIMPSSTVSKIASVKCNEAEAYVRMKYTVVILDCFGRETDLDPSIIQIAPSGVGSGWVDGGDGWYYYDAMMTAGDVTEPLFEEVICSAETGNEYQSTTVVVRVHAQSVQAKNNAAPGGDVTAVKGWPMG